MAWDTLKYFTKAQLYWERASSASRDSDQFLMNVAFSCEFVIRGALCKINPALNAAPDTESLLYAAGLVPRKSEKTIDIGEGLKRLHRFLPEITEDAVVKVEALFVARNKELHGDNADIAALSSKELMPSIFQLIICASSVSTQNLEILLGQSDAAQAKQVVEANSKDRKKRVQDLIRICKDRFYTLNKMEQEKKREDSKISYSSAVLTSGHHVKKEKCPSCGSYGLIIGTPVGRSAPILRGSEIVEEVRIVPTKFECKCCELEIKGLDELMAAGFSHEYCTFDEINPVDHFSIDPMDYIDVDEVIREHGRDMTEYMDE